MSRFLRPLAKLLRESDGKVEGESARLREELGALRLGIGALQARSVRTFPPNSLHEAEFRVFSQFGEDGIIQYLIHQTAPLPQIFVEFGVEDYTEANTLFLLLHNNWKGLILDGSAAAMSAVRRRALYWRHDLTAAAAFITRENINDLITANGISGPIGLLSIDIDGNDYWVWENLTCVNPVIVVAEYNSVFGAARAVSVPYDPAFQRTQAHHSNLYWGCSLGALCELAHAKGYEFVGSNSIGNNAFFVRKDRLGKLPALTPAEGYVESRFRESRDAEGNLTFLAGAERLKAIAHLPVVDVVSGQTINLRDM